MKRYKIVKTYISPTDYMFRIYKRQWLFFWSWETSCSTIERCKHQIASWIEEKHKQQKEIANTPKSKVVEYL